MERIPDDPIVRCIEDTGYPPWFYRTKGEWHDIPDYFEDEFDGEEDSDVYYGNSTDEF